MTVEKKKIFKSDIQDFLATHTIKKCLKTYFNNDDKFLVY